MDRHYVVKQKLEAYLTLSNDILGADWDEELDLIDNLTSKRDVLLDELKDLDLATCLRENKDIEKLTKQIEEADKKIKVKIDCEMNVCDLSLHSNLDRMADYGRNKIAMQNYVKTYELDDESSFYMDKKQ